MDSIKQNKIIYYLCQCILSWAIFCANTEAYSGIRGIDNWSRKVAWLFLKTDVLSVIMCRKGKCYAYSLSVLILFFDPILVHVVLRLWIFCSWRFQNCVMAGLWTISVAELCIYHPYFMLVLSELLNIISYMEIKCFYVILLYFCYVHVYWF